MPEKLCKGYSYRGADMGRPNHVSEPKAAVKFHLRKMPLSDGYDKGGAYWGWPDDMWHAWGEEQEMFFRAPDRQGAKAEVLDMFPDAKFYR